MSRMLTFAFVDTSLAAARTLAAAGRRGEALRRLDAALGPIAGTAAAADAHRFAAELHRAAGRFAKARRHLRAGLAVRPADAALHHDLGLAFADDPYGCDRRAAARFRVATAFAPNNAKYRAAYGLALVRLDKVTAGVRELDAAVALAPTDDAVLDVVLIAAREADRPELAVKWLARAVLLAPANAGLRQLRDRAKFDAARVGQEGMARVGRRPTVPFLRLAAEGGTVRRDAGSRPTPHFNRLRAFRG
jgi:tetratricopeptide (TPR) repeat protein